MLIAINQNNQYCLAGQASQEIRYRCPACQQLVVLRHGKHNVAHFAHGSHSQCQPFSEGESLDHLLGKIALYEYFRQTNVVFVEPVLSAIDQRPDLLVKRYKQADLVLEYQCSPISQEKVAQRNAGFARLGYQVYWILGPSYYVKRLSGAMICRFWQENQLHFYLPKTKKFYTRYNFRKVDFHRLSYHTLVSDYPKLFIKPSNRIVREEGGSLASTIDSNEFHQFCQRQRAQLNLLLIRRRVDPGLVNYLYRHGLRVNQLPDWCLQGQAFGLTIPNWQFRLFFLLLLAKLEPGQVVPKQLINQRLKSYFYFGFADWPQVLIGLYQELNHLGVLKQDDGEFILAKLPQFVHE